MVLVVLMVLFICVLTRRWMLLLTLISLGLWTFTWLVSPWVGGVLAVVGLLILVAVFRTERQDEAAARRVAVAHQLEMMELQAEMNADAMARKARGF